MAEITQLVKSIAIPGLTKTVNNNGSVFDVNKITNAINQYNFQKTNLGQVIFTMPKVMLDRYPTYTNKSQMMTLYTEAFNVPSMGLATTEVRRYGEGPLTKHAYLPLNVDVNFSVICDGKGILHSYFYRWMKSIVRANDRNLNGETQEFSFPFEVTYYDDYVAPSINLYVFDEAGEVIMVSILYNAFPTFVSDLQMNWNSNNDLSRMNITMTYEYVDNIYLDDRFNEKAPQRKDNLSTLQKIIKTATAVQTLSTLRKPRSVGDILNVTNNTANIFKAF